MFEPQKKHKAQHGGYRDKPTKSQVQANLDFWEALRPDGYKTDSSVAAKLEKPGKQFTIQFPGT